MENKLPFVSICIPAYNAEKYIVSTIKSALNQTWQNKEIIVVDDGSTDQTLKILKTFESENVKVFSQKNKGASAARNYAYSLAQGDFIQWLDADDILAPNKIETQINYFIKNPDPLILHSSPFGIFYYRLKKAKFTVTPIWKDLTPREWMLFNLDSGYFMFPACWLVSRQLTELAGQWNENLTYNDDGEYFFRIVSKSKYIKFHPDAKCYYRKGNLTSISASIINTGNAHKSLRESIYLCVDHLLSIENSLETRTACINALNRIAPYKTNEKIDAWTEINNKIIELGGNIRQKEVTPLFSLAIKILSYKRANNLRLTTYKIKVLLISFFDKLNSIIYSDGI